MKKLMLLSCLMALAACDSDHKAAQDCTSLNYKPGSPDYQRCKAQMSQAEKMQSNPNMQ